VKPVAAYAPPSQAAHGGLAKAREKEVSAKADDVVACASLRVGLTDRFADDPRRVRGYFPPRKPS
jgi:hypothetical protein